MTSAECTMGLRSFLINDEQNARRCVNNPHIETEKHDLEEEEQFTEDSAMIPSMSNSYSPHKYSTGRNMATEMTEYAMIRNNGSLRNGHVFIPSNEAVDLSIDGGSHGSLRRRQHPVVLQQTTHKRNHFLLDDNRDQHSAMTTSAQPIRHIGLPNNGGMHLHHHNLHRDSHYHEPSTSSKAPITLNGHSPSAAPLRPTSAYGAEETLANGHIPTYSSPSTVPIGNGKLPSQAGRHTSGHHTVSTDPSPVSQHLLKEKGLYNKDTLRSQSPPPQNGRPGNRIEVEMSEINMEEDIGSRLDAEDDAREADDEVTQTMLNSMPTLPKVVPTKDDVMEYMASTRTVQIRRTGTELQVTDSSGYPLLDVWLKTSCFRRGSLWILESYGKTVLLLSDINKGGWFGRKGQLPPRHITTIDEPQQNTATNSSNQDHKSVLQVLTPDNDILGFFVVGDPFILQNHEQKTIARFVSSGISNGDCVYANEDVSPTRPNHNNRTRNEPIPMRSHLYQCLLESKQEEIGRLEIHPALPQLCQVQFGSSALMTFPLKLLVLTAAIRLAAAITSPAPSRSPERRKGEKTLLKVESTSSQPIPQSNNCCTIV